MSLIMPFMMELNDGNINHPCHCHHRQQCHSFSDFADSINPLELNALLGMPSELLNLQQRAQNLMIRKGSKHPIAAPKIEKKAFQVSMDIQQFTPEEVTVKTVGKCVIVEFSHDERPDEHGFISRTFTRRYTLPKGCDHDAVTSSLSSDGVLTIAAPQPKALENSNERVIAIQQTGPARLSVKENQNAGDEEGKQASENDK